MSDLVGRRTFVAGATAAAFLGGSPGPAHAAELVGGNLPDFHPALKDELRFPLA